MSLNIIVTAKQVVDPETPASALRINAESRSMEPPASTAPVINGFDENAIEAALRIKDALGGSVTVVSVGNAFAMDVIKKPLSMGCDELVLVQDDALTSLDANSTAHVLLAVIRKLGVFDLILSGRQASDYDQAQVPQMVSEGLDVPCITIAKKIEVKEKVVVVDRVLRDGFETVSTQLPAVVTVSNELGTPRYPTLRGIMAASRKQPTVWTLDELGVDQALLSPKVELLELYIPASASRCEFIEGDSDEEKGRNLALKMREAKII